MLQNTRAKKLLANEISDPLVWINVSQIELINIYRLMSDKAHLFPWTHNILHTGN